MESTSAFQKGCLGPTALYRVINARDFTVNLSISDGASGRKLL